MLYVQTFNLCKFIMHSGAPIGDFRYNRNISSVQTPSAMSKPVLHMCFLSWHVQTRVLHYSCIGLLALCTQRAFQDFHACHGSFCCRGCVISTIITSHDGEA